MQLKKLQQYIEQYKRYLGRRESGQNLYKWESQQMFQEKWDLEATDLEKMFDHSFQNSKTRRLWKRENYEPKRLMLEFIRMQADFVRFMFADLFNEEMDVENRVDRFVYYADELLQEYKTAHPVSIENNHYQDYPMVFLYLAFRFPESYTFYDFDLFRSLLEKLGVSDLPVANDGDRFVKVSRTLYKFLAKDEQLMALHRKRLRPQEHYMEPSLLLVHDFSCFCVDGI